MRDTSDTRSFLLGGIFVLLSLYTLYFAASILLPIILALLLSLVLMPLVRGLAALRIPPPLGGTVVLVLLLAFLGQAAYLLSGPAAEWLEKAPQSFREVERRLRTLQGPIEEVRQAAGAVEKHVGEMTGPDSQPADKVVAVQPFSLTSVFLSGTPRLLVGMGVTVVLLYFLLASGDTFLRKTVRIMPRLSDKKRAVEIARGIQRNISYYCSPSP